jgi:hypothetical protein
MGVINAIGGYLAFPINYASSARTSVTDTATGDTHGDEVSLSSEGMRLNLLDNFMDGAGRDGVITLDEMRAFRDERLTTAQNILQDTLNELNIDSTARFEIDMDPLTNEVAVAGGADAHNGEIAAALQDNERFKDAWKAASAVSTLLAAAEAAIPFQNAYRSDPEAALAQYNLTAERNWDFTMYFEDGNIDYSVA